MSKVISGAIISLALGILPASAQNARSFVSALGSDANACSRPAPCRTFQRAHDVTNANGEIDVIDPAGYGPLAITKGISIQGHGFSGISVSSNINAITISAGASDGIFLNGLLIDGSGAGNVGILLNSGGVLTIVNCVVRHFAGVGIWVQPNTGTTIVNISDTIASENADTGILFNPSGSATVKGAIKHTTTNKNPNGGIYLFGAATAMVVDSISSHNGYGLVNQGGASTRLSRFTASGNNTGVYVDGGGPGYSYGDNNIDGNTSSDVFGSLTRINPR